MCFIFICIFMPRIQNARALLCHAIPQDAMRWKLESGYISSGKTIHKKKKYLHCRMAVMFSWCEKVATILLFLFSSSLWSCIILYVSSIFSAIIHWPKFCYGLHSFVFFYQFTMRSSMHTHNFHSKYYPNVYFK